MRLETDRLILRPPDLADAPAIRRLAGDWEVARYTARIPHPYEDGMAESWLASLQQPTDEDAEIVLAVERRADGAFLGCIGLSPDPAAGTAEVGYWLGRPFWGQGYATEALAAFVGFAFDHFGLAQVTASAMPENRGSIRVQEKVGFTFVDEGEEPAPARGGPIKVERRLLTRAAFEQSRAAGTQADLALPIVLVVAVALVDLDGRVLLAQRPEGKPLAGLWEFPGGKVHPGETPEAALIRELQEELGIDVAESCLAPFTFASHRYETFHLLMPLYVCRVWKGQVRALEGQALAWVRPNRITDYPMPPADKPLVAMLRDLL